MDKALDTLLEYYHAAEDAFGPEKSANSWGRYWRARRSVQEMLCNPERSVGKQDTQ